LDVINGLNRWKRVELLREKANEIVNAGVDSELAKYARSNRNTSKAQRTQSKLDAQKIFDGHCRVLSESKPPSFSDDDLSDDEFGDLDEGMDMDDLDSPTPYRNTASDEKEEKEEYRKFLMERERLAQAVDVSTKEKSRKKTVKRKVIKRTVTYYFEDGTSSSSVTFIDDPTKVNDFILDKQDGGSRFKDSVEEFKSSLPAMNSRGRISEPKKRRRKKKEGLVENSNQNVTSPSDPSAPDSNSLESVSTLQNQNQLEAKVSKKRKSAESSTKSKKKAKTSTAEAPQQNNVNTNQPLQLVKVKGDEVNNEI
jgi:hypothetical protein